MRYCVPCALKNHWSYWPRALSRGRCEVCGETADCNDRPREDVTGEFEYPDFPGRDDAETSPTMAKADTDG